MNWHLLIPSRAMLTILCGMGLAVGLATSPASADQWSKRTILTVNDTIQVTDTVLQPGQYVLRLLDSPSERHVVQIFDRDQKHIINTVIAIPTMRLQPTGDTAFTFWETPPGNVRALRTWYYPGDNYGQEFRYPKHLQQVAMLMPPAPAPQPAAPEPAAEPAPAPAPENAPEAAAEPAPAPEPQQPAETAQANPPETPAQEPEKPAQLPKTGTFYPEIGIAGGLLLGLGGLLRLRRQS